jgi:UDP:flavonoid glycosyltransferase YjiC (YdhE family)
MAARNVLIGCAPEWSSFNGALVLARHLGERGHRVRFVGGPLPHFKGHVERNGFEYQAIGSSAGGALGDVMGARNPARLLRAMRAVQAALVGEMDALADGYPADLAFLDANATLPAAYLLAKRHIPTLVLITTYASRFSLDYPPIFSSRVPLPGPLAKVENLVLWSIAWARRRLAPLRSPYAFPIFLSRVAMGRFQRLATELGWAFCYGEWGIRPERPEIVIAHGSADWPALRSEDRLYLTGSASARVEEESDWSAGLDPKKPLVYCAISSMFGVLPTSAAAPNRRVSRFGRDFKRFLDVLVESFSGRSDLMFVLSCGPFVERYPGGSLPDNVRLFESVPQIDVLKRAALAITQGGAATVRECISLGVPMLLFPMWSDQYGNGARIVHHRLGLTGDYRTITSPGLLRMVDAVLGDREVTAAVSAHAQAAQSHAAVESDELASFVRRHASVEL